MADFLLHLGWILILIAVHESGHYLAGRLGGIPGAHLRVRWLAFPQYVAVQYKGRWLSPSDTAVYIEAVWHYLRTPRRVYFYVAGGFLLETIFTVLAFVLLMVFGWEEMALPLARMTVALLLPWLLIDTFMIMRKQIIGDFSALWQLALYPTAFFMAAMVLIRAALLWYV